MTLAATAYARPAAPDPGPITALDRVVARVRLRAACRAAWLDALWRESEAAGAAGMLDAIVEDRDAPYRERRWRIGADALGDVLADLARVEAELEADTGSRLARLIRLFGIEGGDRDVLHLAIAAAEDPGLGRIFAHVAEDGAASAPTDALAGRLFDRGRAGVLREGSPLLRWRIVQGDARGLSLDTAIGAWLRGSDDLDPALAGCARVVSPPEPLDGWPADETADALARALNGPHPVPARLIVSGVAGIGRTSFAACVADRLGMSLLKIERPGGALPGPEEIAVRAHRQARLANAAPAWPGADRVLPLDMAPVPLRVVSTEPNVRVETVAGTADFRVALDVPDTEQRRRLWRLHLGAETPSDAAVADRLAAQYRTVPGAIAAVAARRPRDAEEAIELLRGLDRDRLAPLARRVETGFGRADLVVSPRVAGQLDTLEAEARVRIGFWERPESRRLWAEGRGLAALFVGPPGTGKTMAAQVLAREIGFDLYRVDLSSVVSKYVGETAENVERVLATARAMDIVLLFDEADGLFGRRTEVADAQSRFANTETAYLLQAIESHDGIVILSSNRRRNIDDAFLRRFRYVIEFGPPDEAARRALLHVVVGGLAGEDARSRLGDGLDRIAARLELTGAQIKSAALTAAFLALDAGEPLGIDHLLRGCDLELGKEGRALGDRDKRSLEAAP